MDIRDCSLTSYMYLRILLIFTITINYFCTSVTMFRLYYEQFHWQLSLNIMRYNKNPPWTLNSNITLEIIIFFILTYTIIFYKIYTLYIFFSSISTRKEERVRYGKYHKYKKGVLCTYKATLPNSKCHRCRTMSAGAQIYIFFCTLKYYFVEFFLCTPTGLSCFSGLTLSLTGGFFSVFSIGFDGFTSAFTGAGGFSATGLVAFLGLFALAAAA